MTEIGRGVSDGAWSGVEGIISCRQYGEKQWGNETIKIVEKAVGGVMYTG
jgi:hypothetical protein